MKISVWRGGKQVELEVVEAISKDKVWVETTLSSFFASTSCGIKYLKFYEFTNGEELIRVFYDLEHPQYYKDVWVTGDSRAAMVEDMYRQCVVY